MRTRALLGVAFALVAAVLILELSRSAPRGAGSNHVSPAVFAASVPGGGTLCQPSAAPPADAARAQVLIATNGRPVPALALGFTDARGAAAISGALAAGAREGLVTVPLRRRPATAPASASAANRVCLHVGGHVPVLLGGEAGPLGAAAEVVDGHPQEGHISLLYVRPGRESWWQLLPALDTRFGLGKAAIFGDWTLPAAALALLGVWIAVARLLARELRRSPAA